MRSQDDTSPFTVEVEAGFSANGVWIIRAIVRYRDGVPEDGSTLLGEARLALLAAIAEAGSEGRKLGATEARVYLDDGVSVRVIDPGAGPVTLR